jgi:hypothetical protein
MFPAIACQLVFQTLGTHHHRSGSLVVERAGINAVPRSWSALLSLDEGAPDPHLGREHAESALSQGAIADAGRDRLAAALLCGDARSAVYCPTFTEGTSGRKKYQKKVIA